MIGLDYNETVRLIKLDADEYGGDQIDSEAEVPAIIGQVTGWQHGANQSSVTADSVAYLDPTNAFVIANYNELDGMMLVTSAFGQDVWYRIVTVNVGTDNLLSNNIDHVQVDLKKTAPIS